MRDNILSIEDDPTVQEVIRLSLNEYNVTFTSTIKDSYKELERNTFAAILFDIQLPDGDGLHLYTKLIQEPAYQNIPIFFLTSKKDISNKLIAFNLGADDFIEKPFDPLELRARVSSKIKKQHKDEQQKQIKVLGDLHIDFDRQKAFQQINGKELDLDLTANELKILAFLAKHIGNVYSREQILDEVWGNISITDRTIDSHIAHLRKKIIGTKITIETIKYLGYKLILNN